MNFSKSAVAAKNSANFAKNIAVAESLGSEQSEHVTAAKLDLPWGRTPLLIHLQILLFS
jgi:hypothetical protein